MSATSKTTINTQNTHAAASKSSKPTGLLARAAHKVAKRTRKLFGIAQPFVASPLIHVSVPACALISSPIITAEDKVHDFSRMHAHIYDLTECIPKPAAHLVGPLAFEVKPVSASFARFLHKVDSAIGLKSDEESSVIVPFLNYDGTAEIDAFGVVPSLASSASISSSPSTTSTTSTTSSLASPPVASALPTLPRSGRTGLSPAWLAARERALLPPFRCSEEHATFAQKTKEWEAGMKKFGLRK